MKCYMDELESCGSKYQEVVGGYMISCHDELMMM